MAFLASSAGSAFAGTLTVGPGGGYDFTSIQAAIAAAGPGDTVLVYPGIYHEDISFNGTNITVKSEYADDPCCVAATIIQGTGTDSVVTFSGSEDASCVLEGFTITDGNAPWFGGGVNGNGTGATIRHCIIRNNEAFYYGGGLAYCDGQISNCTIRDNSGCDIGRGGGLAYCHGLIKNCLVQGNSTESSGGGLYHCWGTISNCAITYNSAFKGGGLQFCTGPIRNCTIANNHVAEYGSGLESCSGPLSNCTITNNSGAWSAGLNNCSGSITNCIIWDNNPRQLYDCSAPTYSCVGGGGAAGIGNMSDDPCFVNPDADDYHLQVYSPCINAGDPGFVAQPDERDIDGEARVFAGRVDMGTDEYVGHLMPIADAGPDQYVEQVQLVGLNGSGSFFYDPFGTKEFQWTQIAGPQVHLSDSNAVQPSFMPEVEAEYRFELVVNDDLYTSYPDEVLIVVGNRPPVANAGSDILCAAGELVTLDGTASYDLDPGQQLSYMWTQRQGPNVTLHGSHTPTPYFDCAEHALYEFELIVSDAEDDSQPSSVQVVTVDANIQQQELAVRYEGGYNYNYPDISGNKVVYASNFGCPLSWDLKCKDMSSGYLYVFGGGGIHAQPKIEGNLIVLFGAKSSGDIGAYDRSSISYYHIPNLGQETLRGYTATESYSHPAISGTKVVWLEHLNLDPGGAPGYNLPYNICGADVTTINDPVFFTIATNVGRRDVTNNTIYEFDDVVDICGDIVVWEGGGDIYGADISDLADIEVFPICTHAALQFDPAVSGNLVVWTDERSGRGDIYGADISDRANIQPFAIIEEDGLQEQPAVSGRMIVYVDFVEPPEGGIGEIRVCYLTTRHGPLEIPLSERRYGVGPAMDGDKIVWQGRHSYDGLAEGISLQVAYCIADGAIENLTSGRRYDYLRHAVYQAELGDEIVAGAGTYHESFELKGKNLVVRSADPNDRGVVAATVISGHGQGPVVTFAAGENETCVLAGFTVTDGNDGIYCGYARPRIVNCIITGNKDSGIDARAPSDFRMVPAIVNCKIVANGGDGVFARSRVSPSLTNCVIAKNKKAGVNASLLSVITNCTIVGNGLAGLSTHDAKVSNCIIRDNMPPQIVDFSPSAVVIYSDVQGGYPGQGNIDADPLFRDPDNLDYHLRSGSPCIDTGNPTGDYAGQRDIDGDPRVINGRVDMGVDEFDPQVPVIHVSATQFDFLADVGAPNPDPQVLSISNIGGGTLNWAITYDCNWLSVVPSAGQSAGESDDVVLSVNTAGLSKGDYTCDLTVSAPGADNTPQTVRVNLFVEKILRVPTEVYPTIQAAIDAATAGDIVVVADGTHTGEGNRDLDFKGKAITVRSQNGPTDCIIDCQGTQPEPHRAFRFHSGETALSIVEGFTITKGYAGFGGAIENENASPTIKNCIFANNTADMYGGAIENYYSSPNLTNCVFTANAAGVFGGGIDCYGASNPAVTNCILWADTPDEIYSDGVAPSVTYCDVQAGYPGEGNIDANPLLVGAASGDFHLSPGSPAIDAGHPLTDWTNEPWPNGGRVNMGAYGNTSEATRSPADFDDLALLCDHWLQYEPSLDIAPEPSGDGVINFLDFAFLADCWLR
jgi:beta propeller repeat protein